jgi:putative acetyltransferase
MITLTRTDSSNLDFQRLVTLLDNYLEEIDGDEHDFFSQFNHNNNLDYVVLAYKDGECIGSGAMEGFDAETMEIKRIFVLETARRLGAASQVMDELEKWTVELGYKNSICETGIVQNDSVKFYFKRGYHIIPNYGHYQGFGSSICFKKVLQNLA